MKLNQLPQIAEETLSGLKADQALFKRIQKAGNQTHSASTNSFQARRRIVLATTLVLAVGLSLISPVLFNKKEPVNQQIQTHMAGFVPQVAVLRAGNLPQGSISLGSPGKNAEYKGIWANASGGNFPLIRVDSAFYRLLKNPTAIDSSLLGANLGRIEIFTEEPALDSSGQLLSNSADENTQVYQIKGMAGTAIAAEIDGKLRVFQRISFSGNALLGSESLIDTLRGPVTGLQLSGVGTVTETSKITNLLSLLFNESSFQSSATSSSNQALLIQYSNGIVLQMAVKGNNLIACGTWNNAEFIEAFEAAVE